MRSVRSLRPVECLACAARRRHDDAGEKFCQCRRAGQYAAQCFNDRLGCAQSCEIGGHGACAIAASLNLAAIGIENLHEHIARIARRVQNQKLVASVCYRMVARGQRAHVFGRQARIFAAGVNHHKIIAEAVHFGESDGACLAHACLYNPSRLRTPAPAMCRLRAHGLTLPDPAPILRPLHQRSHN